MKKTLEELVGDNFRMHNVCPVSERKAVLHITYHCKLAAQSTPEGRQAVIDEYREKIQKTCKESS